MSDTNERQVTNTCTHTDDGKVCAKCLGTEAAKSKDDATLAEIHAGFAKLKAIAEWEQGWRDLAAALDARKKESRMNEQNSADEVTDKTIATLTAERDAAIQRAEQAEALAGILRAAGSEAVDTGVDLLEELARLRKLEAWTKDFVAKAPKKRPELYWYREWADFERDRVTYEIARELRNLITEGEDK